jgi:hypothetical protein
MMTSRIKTQFFEHLDRELERRGMTHLELAERISEAREGAGRAPINPAVMEKSLRAPRTDTGITAATIEEICELIGVIPVLTLISPPSETRDGYVPDERDLLLLAMCDREDGAFKASVDDPELTRLQAAGLAAIAGADWVGWYATEAGRQLLEAAAPVGVCEFCRRYMYPGQEECKTPGCCGEVVERPCEICALLYAKGQTCSGTVPDVAPDTGDRLLRMLDPLSPPDHCPEWTPDDDAYHRRLFQVAERGILATGDPIPEDHPD